MNSSARSNAHAHALSPQPPINTIALIGKYHSQEIADLLSTLARHLATRGVAVLIESSTAHVAKIPLEKERLSSADFAEIGQRADVAIVLGGDGTMLSAARHLARYQVPLVGINQGRLGFMTDIASQDMLAAMDDLLAGKFSAENRVLLDAEIWRERKKIASNMALNEVVIEKGAMGKLIEFELFVDQEFVYHLRADGLIASTPTGSTAYSLSANGPIVHPNVPAIALVPLCPHSLTNRPILVGDQVAIDVHMTRASDSRVHLDGQVTLDLKPGDQIQIRRSAFSICFLHPPGHRYFAMLRQKLHWSEQPKNLS